MHVIAYFLVSAFFWMGSNGNMCYQCTQVVKESEPMPAASCASGKFDNSNLPPGVSVKDCGSLGCSKGVVGVVNTGYKSYLRSCGDAGYAKDKCYEVPAIPGLTPQGTADRSEQMLCTCHGDYCNGARMNTQAVVGLIASVIAILVLQY